MEEHQDKSSTSINLRFSLVPTQDIISFLVVSYLIGTEKYLRFLSLIERKKKFVFHFLKDRCNILLSQDTYTYNVF